MTRVCCTLYDVVGDPSVSSFVEREIAWAAKQTIRLVATGVVDLDRHRPSIRHSNERRRIQVAQQRQREDSIHVLPRIASEVRQRFRGIVRRETAGRCRQIKKARRNIGVIHTAAKRFASDRVERSEFVWSAFGEFSSTEDD